jgi:hypothetical protein
MKESYVEGLASHNGPESCDGVRKGVGEALTGVRAGRVSSRESNLPPGCRRRKEMRKATSGASLLARRTGTPRSRRPRACAETPRTGTGRSRVRPTPVTGQAASGSLRTHADDARTWEVGWPHSTWEVPEQREWQPAQRGSPGRILGGGDGGKRASQGKSTGESHPPDSVPEHTGAPGSHADTLEGMSCSSCRALLRVITQGRSRMREIRPSGSVRGAGRKARPYHDPDPCSPQLGSIPQITPKMALVALWD